MDCVTCAFNCGGCTSPRNVTTHNYDSFPVSVETVRGGEWCTHITIDRIRAVFSKN